MTQLGFEVDSPLGQLYQVVSARLSKQGQDIAIVNQGVPGKGGTVENDPEEIEIDELLHFTYSRPEYYPDLYRLGFPLPFVLDDFDPTTKADEVLREKWNAIALGIKKSVAKKYPPLRKPKLFSEKFIGRLTKKGDKNLPELRQECPSLSLFEMARPEGCGNVFSGILFLLAAHQAAGVVDLWKGEIQSPPVNIANWIKFGWGLGLWQSTIYLSFSGEPEEGAYVGKPESQYPLTPLKMTKIWLTKRSDELIDAKQWKEADVLAQSILKMAPDRIFPWTILLKIQALSGNEEQYRRSLLEFEGRFHAHEEFAFVRALIELDRLRWEWGKEILNEGEWVANLKELVRALEEEKKTDFDDYLDNCQILAYSLWEFAANIPVSKGDARRERLKNLIERESYQLLMNIIATRPEDLAGFSTALKIALKEASYLDPLYRASQKLLEKNPDNPFYLYYACLVQEMRYTFSESSVTAGEKELWRSQLARLEKLAPSESGVLSLLGDSLSDFGEYVGAIGYYQKLLPTLPKNSPLAKRMHLVLAQKYGSNGEKEKAALELEALKKEASLEEINQSAREVLNIPLPMLMDRKPEEIKQVCQGFDPIVLWLKQNSTEGNKISAAAAHIVIGYLGAGDFSAAKGFLEGWPEPEALVGTIWEGLGFLFQKIDQEASTPLRLAFLDHLLDGVQALQLNQKREQKLTCGWIQTILLQEALYLRDKPRMRKAVAAIFTSEQLEVVVTMMNRAYHFLEEKKENPVDRQMALDFFLEIESLQSKFPAFLVSLFKTRLDEAALLFAKAGDVEKAKRVTQIGANHGAR